ncbi:hypothetical protein RND81_07G043000 [Saponaria officinalis]|uniref:Endonuclease/exonuclease/phosphatase domain-containing protein n=1 Tax=Saponaria officinalis TaxID=3572 RepID=A0AAW1JM09_SAPOF
MTILKPKRVITNYQCYANGRIWLIWNPSTTTIVPLNVHSQFIHCQVTYHRSNVSFLATFVYASNDPQVRLHLWDSLKNLSQATLDWIVMGDFNIVRDVSERISNHPPNLSDILDFNASRILPFGISDHSPILVSVDEEVGPKRRFSFLNCWVEDPSYHARVCNAWNKVLTGSSMFQFFGKLKLVRTELLAMHKQSFSAIQRRISDTKQLLDNCQLCLQQDPRNTGLIQQEELLLAAYLKFRKAEMSIVKQKA